MNVAARAFLACLLFAGGGSASAAGDSGDCHREQIAAHVLRQFAIYGPQSRGVEYFGFIYRSGDEIQSVVMRGPRCGRGECVMRIAKAGNRIPAGATVVGEWHTHPHQGSPDLSDHDVRGANRNSRVKCYQAFYSEPDGGIFAWNTAKSSVPQAMASRILVGNYARKAGAQDGSRRETESPRSRQASASAMASLRE